MAGGFEKFIYPFLDKSCITPADQVKRGCQEHRDILAKGVENWNSWRAANPDIKPDLSYANFNGHDLRNVNLSNANVGYAEIIQSDLTAANMEHSDLRHTHLHQSKLNHANMKHAFMGRTILVGADLSQACLRDTVLYKASLNHANLHGADVSHAYAEGIELPEANLKEATVVRSNLYQAGLRAATLVRADLSGTNLDDTDLRGADLREAILKDTRMRNALLVSANVNRSTLTGSNVFGVSAWGMKGRPKEQLNLIITDIGEPVITVDNLEIAQFIYLLIRNERIRDVIDTVGNKAVLILGRFTEERKAVLNSIREHLRQLDYVPILFDFETAVAQTIKAFGRPDVLINTAVVWMGGDYAKSTEKEWDWVMDVNLTVNYFMCSRAIPELKRTKGCIVNLSSDAGLIGLRAAAIYCASKGGVVLLTKALAIELAPTWCG